MLKYNYGKGGGVGETLRNYQGGVSANPYGPLQRGEGGSKIRKIALRNLWMAPIGSNKFAKFSFEIFWPL